MTIKRQTSIYIILRQCSLCLSSSKSLYPWFFPKLCFLNKSKSLLNSFSEKAFSLAINKRICNIASSSRRFDSAHSFLTVSLEKSLCIFLGGGATESSCSNWLNNDVFKLSIPMSLMTFLNCSLYLWFVSSLNWIMYCSNLRRNSLSAW